MLVDVSAVDQISKRMGISRCSPWAFRILSTPVFVWAGFCESISATRARASRSAWMGSRGAGRGSEGRWAKQTGGRSNKHPTTNIQRPEKRKSDKHPTTNTQHPEKLEDGVSWRRIERASSPQPSPPKEEREEDPNFRPGRDNPERQVEIWSW